MHPSRRRKKRPNYGIRTVEVIRGPNGFGFTISGQQPCILSCIVANSPADQAGLRAGDFLISVNSVSVSKITHDAVVNLIGNSIGPIKMTIAENYYSDSSDEDINLGRMVNSRKPKYLHKPRMHRGHKYDAVHKRVAKKEPVYCADNYEEGACSLNVSNPMEEEGGPIEYKAIVGYLGTIEMPKQLHPNSRLQTVCGCIKKLRQEKRKPTAVLMTVLPTCLTLKNASNHILAIYPTNRVVYISSSMDKDSRYFGLVTSAVCDRSLENVQKKCEMSYTNVWDTEKKCNNADKGEIEVSNSCHVFVTDPKIIEHNLHSKKAESFRITCTNDVVTGYCLEFPRNALYIVSLVQNMYRLQSTVEPHRAVEDLVANSPQPSASSNSDSGIGFRDDCGNISDRILLVEFPANRQLAPILPNNTTRPINIIAANIPNNEPNLNNVRAKLKLNNADSERPNLNNIRACENLSIKNVIEKSDYLIKQNNDNDRLNCRAILDLGVFSERAIDVPDEMKNSDESIDMMDFKSSIDNISMHSSRSLDSNAKDDGLLFKVPFLETKKRHKRAHNLVGSCESLVGDKYESSLLSYKLSPKVFGVNKPNYSCEELSKMDAGEKCGGSLQDLTSWLMTVGRHRGSAQSEPDVRMSGDRTIMCEDNGAVKSTGEAPAVWATSFEKLLECPVGLHTFAEFLKKEFSAENIYFWTACERFRKMPPGYERTSEAHRIYQQHLKVGASEAVNVDSQTRQCAEQSLKNVTATIFVHAQKHIFNLMKFDSYSRFLKSDLYKQCVAGKSEPYQQDPSLLLHTVSHKLKKSLSNAEDRRRKSLLPWHRTNRSKSKDRTESAPKKCDVNENITASVKNSEVHSSRSSLTSLDLAISANVDPVKVSQDNTRSPLCRVNLKNGSTTVVQIKKAETIQELVNRLLEKRGIVYTAFEVSTDKHRGYLNVHDPSTLLAGCEVDIVQKVTFRLDLPNKKVISVKSKCAKVLDEVVRSILGKYSYNPEEMLILRNNEPIDIMVPVTNVDGGKLSVQFKHPPNSPTDFSAAEQNGQAAKPTVQKSLDEITNRVYEDILQEKSDASRSDRGSAKSDDWGSEHSSGFIGRFLKRDSERNRDRKKKVSPRSNGNSVSSSAEDVADENAQSATATFKKPLIAKLKAGVKIQNTSESEELYEGLSRAQRSRLEDQRGTEINFELPDFLKDKENEQSRKLKRMEVDSRFYPEIVLPPKQERAAPSISAAKNLKLELHSNYENRSLITDGNNRYNNFTVYLPNKYPGAVESGAKSPSESVVESKSEVMNGTPRVEPPPLPPKPKILPMKPSNWKQRDVMRKECAKGLYLEQPTSSFV